MIVLTTGISSCAMEERRRAPFIILQAWRILALMVLQGVLVCSTMATHNEQLVQPVSGVQSHKLNQDTKFPTNLRSSTPQSVKEQSREGGHRLLKEGGRNGLRTGCASNSNDNQNTLSKLSNMSSSISGKINGIKGALIHDLSVCSRSSSSAGKNTMTTHSSRSNRSREVEERIEYLKCLLEKSASRVSYLLSRKTSWPPAERQMNSYALHTKQVNFALLDEALDLPASEYEEFENIVLREVQKSSAWNESYESDVWSQPGEYLMNIEIGTPTQSLKGIVDTASDLTWFQCKCIACYEQTDPIYDPSNSSTYEEVCCDSRTCSEVERTACDLATDGCDYLFTYGDNSFTYGTLSTDTFTLTSTNTDEPSSIPNITFGCSRSSRGTFAETEADGVMALGGGSLSFATQLGKHISDRFAYCLVSRWHSSDVTSPIYFGDAALTNSSGMQYTSILKNKRYQPYYYVQMVGISVGGKRLNISSKIFDIESNGGGGTIVDSGTTFTNLRSEAYRALVNAMNSSVQYPRTSSYAGFDLCFDVEDDYDTDYYDYLTDLADVSFPSLVFYLDGVEMDLPTENYMLQVEPFVFCLVIDESPDHLSVLGNVQQQNFRVLYDRENSRMGFERFDCHRDWD